MNLERWTFLDALKPILPYPMWAKAAAVAVIAVTLVVLYVFLGWRPLQDEIAQAEQRVQQEQLRYERNQRLARNLPEKRRQYEQLKKQLQVALAMLPKRSQIPELLEQMSWTARNAGIEFYEFQPQGEVARKIYAEVPVSLKMIGTFRQLMAFLKNVGELPRIVNVSGLQIQKRTGSQLSINGRAVTYRFLEQSKKKRGKRRRAGRRRR